jgi:hypothetical protein
LSKDNLSKIEQSSEDILSVTQVEIA